MVHGGTNFGFYKGANTGSGEFDYKADLTFYDYDAPITEFGDIDNPKFQALQRVINKYNAGPHFITPSNKLRKAYDRIKMQMTTSLFDLVSMTDPADIIISTNPISIEFAGQSGNILRIPKVHDRAQVFVSCRSQDVNVGVLRYIGTIERWNNQPLSLPTTECTSNTSLFILVENMGRVNYGPYLFDEKMIPLPFHNLNQEPNLSFEMQHTKNRSNKFKLTNVFTSRDMNETKLLLTPITVDIGPKEPALFAGEFSINSAEEIKDTYLSFNGWGKGVAFVNEFNIGRYWPSVGPQSNLYVPAPLLKHGKNTLVIFELESPHPELLLEAVAQQDFTCSSNDSKVKHL